MDSKENSSFEVLPKKENSSLEALPKKENTLLEALLKMTKFQNTTPQNSFLPRKIGLGFSQKQTSNREIIKDIIKKKHTKNIEIEEESEEEELDRFSFIKSKRNR